METLWFIIVGGMLAIYVVLDGFDLGAGIIYFLVARNANERRLILRAIGPVWDGNEVWLLAAGGTLFFAFPRLYAASFSGFYLPLMMVLWLLMLRGVGIEFRTHLEHPVWQSFYDSIFFGASSLLAIVFGAALGNVVRGVPLNSDGYFFEPLWTNFLVGPNPGILDWYTVLAGLVALVTLTVHGALYISVKTEGDLSNRSRRLAFHLVPLQALLTLLSLLATANIHPGILKNYFERPVGLLIPLLVTGSLFAIFWCTRSQKDKAAFCGSSVYIAAMLAGAAFGLYPKVLPSSIDSRYDLDIFNAAAGRHGLSVGFMWWTFGMVLAVGYFVFIYRMFKGKVTMEGEGY